MHIAKNSEESFVPFLKRWSFIEQESSNDNDKHVPDQIGRHGKNQQSLSSVFVTVLKSTYLNTQFFQNKQFVMTIELFRARRAI